MAKGDQPPQHRFAPVISMTPEELGAFVKSEIAKWAPVVEASGA